MPASINVSRSNPTPKTFCPGKFSPSAKNAVSSLSIIATEWPSSIRRSDKAEPTRPQPIITTCTWEYSFERLADSHHVTRKSVLARGVVIGFEHICCVM